MGMFDYVVCKYPLGLPGTQDLEYQSKSIGDCVMSKFTITEDGRLTCLDQYWEVDEGAPPHSLGAKADGSPILVPAQKLVHSAEVEMSPHGDFNFYTNIGSQDDPYDSYWWVEYRVRFTYGRVEWVRPTAETLRTQPKHETEKGDGEEKDDSAVQV